MLACKDNLKLLSRNFKIFRPLSNLDIIFILNRNLGIPKIENPGRRQVVRSDFVRRKKPKKKDEILVQWSVETFF